jgi:hypothetical protein
MAFLSLSVLFILSFIISNLYGQILKIDHEIQLDTFELAWNYYQYIKSNNVRSIKKNVYSSNTRLLFVAGLDGSGHDILKTMFNSCKSCKAAPSLSHALMYHDEKHEVLRGLFSTNDTETVMQQFSLVADEMKKLVGGPNDEELHIIGLSLMPGIEIMSYPNSHTHERVMNHPDLQILAFLSEKLNIDLRILVLQTSSQILLSDVTSPLEERVLIEAASAFYTELKLLDSKFLYCISPEKIYSMSTDERQAMAEFIHPSIVPKVLNEMWKEVKPLEQKRNTKAHPYHNIMLQGKLGLVDRLCQDINKA